MPIKRSAAKALRQSKKRTERNQKTKIDIKWLKRHFAKALFAKDAKKAEDLYLQLQKKLDKAVQKGTLKKNTVSRTKSRLSQKLAELSQKETKTRDKKEE